MVAEQNEGAGFYSPAEPENTPGILAQDICVTRQDLSSISALKAYALIYRCPMAGHLLHHQEEEKTEWSFILQRAA